MVHLQCYQFLLYSKVIKLYIYICIYTYIYTTYIHTFFWASLVAQLVKNPPAMQGTLVRVLGWEDPPEKG